MLGVLFHQILAIIPVSFNEFTMGIGYGWISPILSQLQNKRHYSIEELSWIGSIHEFGRIIGPLMSATLLDRIGRKNILMLCAIIFFISWTCIAFTSTVLYIYAARFLFGIGVGMNDVVSSVYVSENYSAKVRAIFCTIVCACFCGGEIVEFVVASMTSYEVIAIINFILSFIGLLTTVSLVETPQYLLMKNKPLEAQRNFEYLRGVSQSNEEFEKIKHNIKEEDELKNVSCKEMFTTPANVKSLTVVLILNVFSMATGYAAITSYMTLIFSSSGALTPYHFTMIYGVIQTVSSFSVPLYVEKFGRRTLVISFFGLIGVANVASAGLLFVHEHVTPVKYFSWLIFFSIGLYGGIYVMLFAIVHLIRGEMFPQSIKAIGGSMTIAVYSTTAFITAKVFLIIADRYGTYVNFLFFGIMSFMSLIYNFFKLPETRGKMLVDIHKALGNP